MIPITQAACQVLLANTPESKTSAAHELSRLWNKSKLSERFEEAVNPPKYPGRPDTPLMIDPKQAKRRRLGSVQGRIALLHAIAHIEFNAIDLAADMVARYAHDTRIDDKKRNEFLGDWISVCDDEARHFTMISDRLNDLGSEYGALPAHNGLWEAAISTMNDLAARLVVAPMILEARGLDVTPNMIQKLNSVGDHKSAEILETIYTEEIGHVAAGARWFFHICQREGKESETYFKTLKSAHFKGFLKPPFNIPARESAGLPQSFYQSEFAAEHS